MITHELSWGHTIRFPREVTSPAAYSSDSNEILVLSSRDVSATLLNALRNAADMYEQMGQDEPFMRSQLNGQAQDARDLAEAIEGAYFVLYDQVDYLEDDLTQHEGVNLDDYDPADS